MVSNGWQEQSIVATNEWRPLYNPEPPQLTQDERERLEGDNIGDTVFSKRSVLALLVRLLQFTNQV